MDGINDFGITYETNDKKFFELYSESKIEINYKYINSNILNAGKIYKELSKDVCGIFIFPDDLSFGFTKKTGASLCRDIINNDNFVLYGVSDINKIKNFDSIAIFIMFMYDKTIESLNNKTDEEKEICEYLHNEAIENTKKIASLISMGDDVVKNCFDKYEYNTLYNKNKSLRSNYILNNNKSNIMEFINLLPTFNTKKIQFYIFDCPVPIIFHDLFSNFLQVIKLYNVENSELYEIMKNERYKDFFKEISEILNI